MAPKIKNINEFINKFLEHSVTLNLADDHYTNLDKSLVLYILRGLITAPLHQRRLETASTQETKYLYKKVRLII